MLSRRLVASIIRKNRHLRRFSSARESSENNSSATSDSVPESEGSIDLEMKADTSPTEAYILPSRTDSCVEGTFLQMPKSLFDRLYGIYGFEPYQKELFEVLDDTGIMIRDPYFQLVDYINKTNFDHPVNRYILCEYM